MQWSRALEGEGAIWWLAALEAVTTAAAAGRAEAYFAAGCAKGEAGSTRILILHT